MSIRSIVAQGRRLVATSFLDVCRVQDRTMVRDTTGGQKETFTERGTDLACRFVAPKDNDPALELESVFGRIEMILEVAVPAADFTEGDRVHNLLDDSLWRVVRNLTPPSNVAVLARLGLAQEVI
jgi:hypothetical protein